MKFLPKLHKEHECHESREHERKEHEHHKMINSELIGHPPVGNTVQKVRK